MAISNSKQLSQKVEQVVGPGLLEGGLLAGADRTAARSPGEKNTPRTPSARLCPQLDGAGV